MVSQYSPRRNPSRLRLGAHWVFIYLIGRIVLYTKRSYIASAEWSSIWLNQISFGEWNSICFSRWIFTRKLTIWFRIVQMELHATDGQPRVVSYLLGGTSFAEWKSICLTDGVSLSRWVVSHLRNKISSADFNAICWVAFTFLTWVLFSEWMEKWKLRAYAMDRVAAGAHLPTEVEVHH